MNDQEEFEKWAEKNGHTQTRVRSTKLVTVFSDLSREAWQGACEYKQKEIDELGIIINSLKAENSMLKENINGTRMKQMNEEIEKLKSENAKLRECVKKVAYSYDRPTDMMNNARQVLKELDGK